MEKIETFYINGYKWQVVFRETKMGYYIFVRDDLLEVAIPLLIEKEDIKNVVKKLQSINFKDSCTFKLFKDIVAGATSFTLKKSL